MVEYGLLIVGIGLVVFNTIKLLMPVVDAFSKFMAMREAEFTKPLAKEQNDEEEKVT